jgi:hypothetical protein
VRVKEAILYPWKSENRLNTLIIPSIILLVFFALVLVVNFGLGFTFASSDYYEIIDALSELATLPFQYTISFLTLGYTWRLITQWAQEGTLTKAPEWRKDFIVYLWDGVKASLMHLFLHIGMILPFVLFLIAGALLYEGWGVFGAFVICIPIALFLFPTLFNFFISAQIQSSQTRTLRDLFNLKRTWQLGWSCYGEFWLALFIVMGLWFLYVAASIVLSVTVIGILLLPTLWAAYHITCWHLYYQAYESKRVIVPVAVTTTINASQH